MLYNLDTTECPKQINKLFIEMFKIKEIIPLICYIYVGKIN